MPHYTARITNLDPATVLADLTEYFESKGLSISPGQARISLATSTEGSKVATVTFQDEAGLQSALQLGSPERLLRERHISLDSDFVGFTPLSDGDDIDIVALHGLNGHAFDTWLYREHDDCFMWLRDSLPEHFPGCRILTYGYNANVISDVSTGRLRNFAETFLEQLRFERGGEHWRKPLILVAHSMGGLVVKQAMIVGEGRADLRYKDIIESIRAIMFFGTPHKGGNGVTPAQIMTNLLQAVNVETRGDLIKELKINSPSLFDLGNDFHHVVRRLGTLVYTMYESKKTHLIKSKWLPVPSSRLLIVPEQSAVIGIPEERKSSVNSTHTSLCKFSGPGDAAYGTVRQALRELKTEITPVVTTQDVTRQPSPPQDLKYINLVNKDTLDSDVDRYPVLEWGGFTYWALSHRDNRYAMTILAFDKQEKVVGRWEKFGARYITAIKLNKGRVEFFGQSGCSISFSLDELRISSFAPRG